MERLFLPWSLFVLLVLLGWSTSSETVMKCLHPAVPMYAKVTFSSSDMMWNTTASYSCDRGYELFGNPNRTCLQTGSWDGEVPYCAANVAYRKPTIQSSTVRGGDSKYANDGDMHAQHDSKFCTETKLENSPWWQVDLLRSYEVRVIRIATRRCCGHKPLHDLEIRVGNSTVMQGNRLCAWYPGTLGEGTTKDFHCAYPIIGRYVYVQMLGVQGSLSLCEVMVFTTQELSFGRCGNEEEPLELTAFNRTCYEFRVHEQGSFVLANDYCAARGGMLVHALENLSHEFLAAELEQRKETMKSKLVWLGARRDPGLRSRTWRWVNGEPVARYVWADDQPNNYNGQQNCVVLDGGRKWMWNDVSCDLDYLPWVCQYAPSSCGSPDQHENSTVEGNDYSLGQVIKYHCPAGHVALGSVARKCGYDGFWTGLAPLCKHIHCGTPSEIKNGKVILLGEEPIFNATTQYVCDANYTLVGSETRTCNAEGQWSEDEPHCLLSICPPLQAPSNGSLQMLDWQVNSSVTYDCAPGFKLVGSKVRTCQLGGEWTGEEPFCKFVQCGVPPLLDNVEYDLPDLRTTYQSRVIYSCNDNYTLDGNQERTCLETGLWSGHDPSCKLITCEEPQVPPGTNIEGDQRSVHAVVRYFCHPGHLLVGPTKRVCQYNGQWSGETPSCKFVDCGRLQGILKGEIRYENGSTFLHSEVSYNCSAGYRPVGSKVRHCMENGRWSDVAPRCEEIRCFPPEIPSNAMAAYGGNDRPSSDSFRIRSTVQYRCISGHRVQGHSLRTCLSTGEWSGHPPSCLYVDCGFPKPVDNGRWLLTSNATYYGSQVEYECNEDYKLTEPFSRLCLENSTWSGDEPECLQVYCGYPNTVDENTIVEGNSFIVGGMVKYSCIEGHNMVGIPIRICQKNGTWSAQAPSCTVVDCGLPATINNGQGIILNGTTTYNSVVEYRCLKDFYILGHGFQTCQADGKWSGETPECTDVPPDSDNAIEGKLTDSQTSEAEVDPSQVIAMATAVGAGGLLILIIVVTVVCIKTRRTKQVKNTENVEVSPSDEKDTTIMSYSRLSLESDPSEHSFADLTPVRNHPNGLVTFSSHPHPIHNGITVNGQSYTVSPGTPYRKPCPK